MVNSSVKPCRSVYSVIHFHNMWDETFCRRLSKTSQLTDSLHGVRTHKNIMPATDAVKTWGLKNISNYYPTVLKKSVTRKQQVTLKSFYFVRVLCLWPPLWSSGQSFWIQIQRSRVRSPALPDFLSSNGSGTGSTQPREVNWGATWIKK
jgi:hypothetical protein